MFNSNTVLDKRVIKLVKYRINSSLGSFFLHFEINHILFLLGRLLNIFSIFSIFRYRSTVIRNLPQLQKLDNVVVQPDEVSEAMRRGIELIHPYDQDESIPYTNYAPPGTQTYQVSTLKWFRF